jgi:hypothetical protein
LKLGPSCPPGRFMFVFALSVELPPFIPAFLPTSPLP